MLYAKYLQRTLVTFFICCLVFSAIVSFQIGVPVEGWSRPINYFYETKTNIANSINRPKLVVVAGSNALFGISCKIVSQDTEIPCVNGGTNAVIGVDYLLYRARSWLKPGDTVIMPLEFHHYTDDGIPGIKLIDYVFARDPQYLYTVNLIDKIHFFLGISFERLSLGIKTKLHLAPPFKKIRQTLNEYGDETKLRVEDMTPKDKQRIADAQPWGEGGYIKSTSGMKSIQEFTSWCKKHKVTVLATWPNTMWFDVYQQQKHQDFFQSIRDFYANINVPIVGNYTDSMYEKSLFFDSNYHLNYQGVKKRTRELIEIIKPYTDKIS